MRGEEGSDGIPEELEARRVSFAIDKLPTLKNGHLKICHLNASLLFVLRAYPDIMRLIEKKRMTGTMQPFVTIIEEVLRSQQETDLVGLKLAMKERHPGEKAYDEGYAQEVLHQLLEDLNKEFTEDVRFRLVRNMTEDKSNLAMCNRCRQPLPGFCDKLPRDLSFLRIRPWTESRQVTIQQLLDKYEERKRDCEEWTACLHCNEQKKVKAVNEIQEAPDILILESTTGATNTINGFEEDVSWGLVTYKPSAVLHHNNREEHFYASVREGEVWWRLDDFCGDPSISRKKYTKRRGVLETSGGVVQRLDHDVVFVLLEKKAAGEEDVSQV